MVLLRTDMTASWRCFCCKIVDGRVKTSPPAATVTPPFAKDPNSFSNSGIILTGMFFSA
jgi:hypothetical protein